MYQQKWKDIPTWEGIYQVSNYARLKRIFRYKDGRIKETILDGYKFPDGYVGVTLYYKGRKEQWRLNRLVATVFQRPLLETEDVHHRIKQLKCCNCVWNIEIKDGFEHESQHKRGVILSQQTKQKMSQSHKGHAVSQQSKQKISNARKGMKFSQEHKRKISESVKKAKKKHLTAQ